MLEIFRRSAIDNQMYFFRRCAALASSHFISISQSLKCSSTTISPSKMSYTSDSNENPSQSCRIGCSNDAHMERITFLCEQKKYIRNCTYSWDMNEVVRHWRAVRQDDEFEYGKSNNKMEVNGKWKEISFASTTREKMCFLRYVWQNARAYVQRLIQNVSTNRAHTHTHTMEKLTIDAENGTKERGEKGNLRQKHCAVEALCTFLLWHYNEYALR